MYRSSPAKPAMKPGDVVAPLHREGGELEGGDPALGAPLQRGDIRRGQVQTHHGVQVRGCLVLREAEIAGADLDEFPTCPQASQRQRRIGPARDHDVHPRRHVLEQERHPVLDLAGVDDVVVVEHEHDVVRDRAELVDQRGEDRLDRRRLRHPEERQRARTDPGRHRAQRRDQVRPEHGGLVVARVQGQPRHGLGASRRGCQPLGEQRRLAEAGRSGHECQLPFDSSTEALIEPLTCDQTAPRLGDVELGLEQRGRVIQLQALAHRG